MKTPALAELYSDPAVQSEARCWTDVWRSTIGGLLADTGQIAHTTDQAELIEQLDVLDKHAQRRDSVATLLSSLPPQTLLENYGTELTLWAIGNDPVPQRGDTLIEHLTFNGYDSTLLRQARLLSWEESHGPRGRDILAHYAVMKAMTSDPLKNIDLPALLQASAAPGVTLSDKRLTEYGLIGLGTEARAHTTGGHVDNWEGKDLVTSPTLAYSMWLDTPSAFALTYKGTPQALVGAVANGQNEFLIRQLQGVRGEKYTDNREEFLGYKSARGLAPLDWQKLLVTASAQLAKSVDMDSVGIVNGHEVPSLYCKISDEDAFRAYDAQADRLGFTLGSDDTWHKPVSDLIKPVSDLI